MQDTQSEFDAVIDEAAKTGIAELMSVIVRQTRENNQSILTMQKEIADLRQKIGDDELR